MLKWAGNLNKHFFFQIRDTNGKKYMKRWSTTLIIKEMQIRTTRELSLHTCYNGYYKKTKDNKY